MKDKKHIKSFNEATENLNISGVSESLENDKKWSDIWEKFKKESGRYTLPPSPDVVLHFLHFLKQNYNAPE